MASDNESNTSIDTVEPGDLSKLLKEYREAAHLNTEQISDALCLNHSAIKALENELFDSLPESPYIRGYLRHYAGLAGKEAKPLIDVYDALKGETSSATPMENTYNNNSGSYQDIAQPLITPQRFKLILLTLLLLLLGLLTMNVSVRDWTSNLWSSFSSPATSTHEEVDSEPLSNLPTLTGDVPGNLPISSEEKSDQPSSSTDDETDEQQDNSVSTNKKTDEIADNETEESSEVETNDSQTGSTKESESTASEANTETQTSEQSDTETKKAKEESSPDATTSADGDTQLKLIFAEKVWLQIKDKDGKRVYEALHPAGTEKTLSLNSPLKFKVGNAPGMKLFVNGEEMNVTDYTKGSVASFGIE